MKKLVCIIIIIIMILSVGFTKTETETKTTITDAEAKSQLRLMVLAVEAYTNNPTEENYEAVWCAYGLYGGAESNMGESPYCVATYYLWESVVTNGDIQTRLENANNLLG